ncbi:MAG: hypothetical protein EOO53_22530, partial [Gammaproteobacteria bacterium]
KGAVIQKASLPPVMAIPHQMHQLFYNLLSNALKFAKKDIAPLIDICIKRHEKIEGDTSFGDVGRPYFEIIIRDNGIGFEQEKAEKIFGMFQRLHSRQDYSGTGIGLAFCRKVVTNHQGHIYATSSPDIGTAFHTAVQCINGREDFGSVRFHLHSWAHSSKNHAGHVKAVGQV